jgi:ribose-phosphate pyrophosphokinase
VIQPTCYPGNTNLMELLIMIDALKRSSARRITAVIPYYGYARQDRKSEPRVPITSKLVADLLVTAGTDRVLTVDLHAGQIQGFFNIPVDHLFSMKVLNPYQTQRCLTYCLISHKYNEISGRLQPNHSIRDFALLSSNSFCAFRI